MSVPAIAEIYRDIKVTPKMRLAAAMYASGAIKTKTEAARVAGVTKPYFTNMTNHNEELRRISNHITDMVEDETVAMSRVLQVVSRKAVGRLAELMNSGNDAVAFRAAQDLADRGQETAKTQKFQVDSLTMNGEDARAIAAAMIESAGVSTKYSDVALNGLIEVDTDKRTEPTVLSLLAPAKPVVEEAHPSHG